VPRVAVLFTGGTISMRFDPAAGGNIPILDGAAILARTRGIEAIADIVPIDRGLKPASHFTFDDLIEIVGVLESALADPAVDGAVVVQGTDTIEETSFAWDLLLRSPKPVVVTGAMRASHEEPFDGPANLRDAVAAAASSQLRNAGVLVSLAGTLEPADDATKMHTAALTTFASPNGGSLGRVVDGAVVIERPRGPRRSLAGEPGRVDLHGLAVVQLVTAGIGSDGSLVDAAAAAGAAGIVVAATGAGNTSPDLLSAAERAMAAGVVVVLASRCPAGAVSTAYAFPGGGATWVRAGAIPVGSLCAIKARVALVLGLGVGMDRDGLAGLLGDPLR
jgi:L-asparaginase